MPLKSKSFRRRLGEFLRRLNPVRANRADRFQSHRSRLGFVPQIEQLESRQLLSATVWVNDNWAVTAPSEDVGHAPIAGDIVANTGAGDDGSVTGKIFGTSAFATVQDALGANSTNDTIEVLAGTYTFSQPCQITTPVTIEGQNYGSGETLTGADGVFNITTNVTLAGGGAMTFTGTTAPNPYQNAAILVSGANASATITGNHIYGNGTGIEFTAGGSGTVSGNDFSGANVLPVPAADNGTDLLIDSTAGSITLGDGNAFAASGDYLQNLSSQSFDLSGYTNTTFGGLNAATTAVTTSSLTSFYAIEDKITDGLDNASYGYVRITGGYDFVTQGSETASAGAIQRGIDLANPYDVVEVQAGTFVASSADNPGGLDVSQPLTLRGAQAGLNPNSNLPITADQTIVLPSASDPNPSDGTSAEEVVYIYSSNVTVDGFTIDGSNPALSADPHTVVVGGVPVNAAEGIVSYSAVGNIAIQNNLVENTTYTGIHFDNYYDASWNLTQAATANNTISDNLLQNLGGGGFDYGIGVYLSDNFYADVQDNVMSNVRVGVQTGNFNLANPGTTASLSDNRIAAAAIGIYYNLHDSQATPFAVNGNTITAVADASIAQWDGILISSQLDTVSASFGNNALDGSSSTAGATFGYYVWSTPTTGSLLISGGSVQGVDYGVCVSNYGDAAASQATISGVTITASVDGVYVADSASSTTHPAVSATVENGSSITTVGSGIGILVSGANASATITGNHIYGNGTGIEFTAGGSGTVSGNDFSGANVLPVPAADNGTDLLIDSSAGSITLGDGNAFAASGDYLQNLSGQSFDLSGYTNTTFGGLNAATTAVTTSSLTSFYAIEDKITDGLDNASYGYVRITGGYDFVTQGSETASAGAIQRGIDLANPYNVVEVQAGTFVASSADNPGGLDVSQPLTLRGAQAGLNPNSNLPTTADQTIVLPSASDPNPSDGTSAEEVVYIDSSNVTVDGFTIDGSNPALSSDPHTVVVGGVPVNAAEGIVSYSAVGNIAIQNNLVENTTYTGIHFDNYYDASWNLTQAATANNTISDNLLQNLGGGGFDYGIGVYLSDNFYADVQDNVMSDVRVGVQTGNFNLANPGTTASLSDNRIAAAAIGIYYNLHDSQATPLAVNGNTITAVADASIAQWDGILISSQLDTVSASFGNNALDGSSSTAGATFGYYVWSTPTTGSLLISGGSVQGVDYGVCVSNYGDAAASQATISGVTITASVDGVYVADSASSTTHPAVSATVENGSSITTVGSGIGILVSGANASATITGNHIYGNGTGIEFTAGGSGTVSGNDFSGANVLPVPAADNGTDLLIDSSAGSITLGDGNAFAASGDYLQNLSGQSFDLSGYTNTTFGGLNAATTAVTTSSLTSFYAIEDKITDGLDNASYGYVRITGGYDFVTQGSETASAGAIQRGIDLANPYNVVEVQAGTFVASSADNPGGLDVSQPLTLRGAQAGLNPNSNLPTTADQTIVLPSASDPNPSDGTSAEEVVYIDSSNVTVDGFTIDGSNPALSSDPHTVVVGGVPVNAAEGIVSYSAVGNIAIQNNLVENTTYTGIHFDNYYDASWNLTQAATANNTISDNLLQNLGGGGFDYGIGVYLSDNFYADVQDNVMSNVRVGVQTGNFNLANPGTTASLSDNRIAAAAIGIYYNLHDSQATPFAVNGNTITAVADASIAQWDGILISSQLDTVSASFGNNALDGSSSTAGATFGYYVWSTPTTGSLLISGGSVQGVDYGVCVSNYGDAAASQATISGVTITASVDGVYVADSASSTTHPAVSATVENGSSITTVGSGIGILVSGANASATITGNHIYGNGTGIEFTAGGSGTVSGNDFSGANVLPVPAADNGTDLRLDSTAGTVSQVTNNSFAGTIYLDNESTQPINATSDTFDVGAGGAQVGGNALTVSEGYATEEGIIDAIDETGLGFVRIKTGNLYVTPQSYVSGSLASGAIARAAAVAVSGDTINIDSALYLTVAPSTSIVYGTPTTTLSGSITAASWVPVPVGGASITVDGIQNVAAITGGTGTFTDSSFPTAALKVGSSPYTITYGYSGGTVGGVNYNYTTDGTSGSISNATTTLTVERALLTITATGVNKTFDGSATATVVFSDNRVSGDVLTESCTLASFNGVNVGTNIPVRVFGLSLSGPDAGNYTLQNNTASTMADITTRFITVTAAANTRLYDGTVSAAATPQITGGSLSPGNTAAFSETYDNPNVGTGKTLTAAGSIADGNNGANYSVTWLDDARGAITSLGNPSISISNGLAASYIAHNTTGSVVQIPVRIDNLIDAAGDQGLTNADVNLIYSTSVDMTGATEVGTTVTVTTTLAHGFTVGESVMLSEIIGTVTQEKFNTPVSSSTGLPTSGFTIASVPNSTTFTFTDSTTGLGSCAGGAATASIFDLTKAPTVAWGPLVSSGWTTTVGTDQNGNLANNTSHGTAGTIQLIAYNSSGNNVTLADPTQGGTWPNGDILAYVTLPIEKNVSVGSTTPIINDDQTASGQQTALISSGQFTGNTYSTLDPAQNATVQIVSSTTQPTATVSVGSIPAATAGTAYSVPVLFTPNTPGGSGFTSAGAIILFDPNYIDPNSITITPGNLLPENWSTGTSSVSAFVPTGNIPSVDTEAINLTALSTVGNIGALASNSTGSLWVISFTTLSGVSSDSTVLNLVSSASGIYNSTNLSDFVGPYTLLPSPTAFATDSVDGTITFTGAVSTATTVTSSNASIVYGTSITFTATVAAASGTVAPLAGSVDFFDTTTNTDLGDGTFETTAGITSTWTLATGAKTFNVTAGDVITATYMAGTGFAGSSGATAKTVTALPITVTAATSVKIYDGTTAAGAAPTITPDLVAGDTAAFTETYDARGVGTGKTLTASGSVNDGNGGSNYAVTYVADTTGQISPLAITVTAAANSKIYDGTTSAADLPTITSGSLVAGDTATFSESYATKNVGTRLTLMPTDSINDGNGGSNYTVTFVADTTGQISPLAITVTALTNSKVYDGTTSAAALPTITSGSLVAGDTATWMETFDTENAGSGKTLTATGMVTDGNGGSNYAVTFASDTTGQIHARSIIVTATSATKVYDGTASAAATPTISSGSLVAGDTAAWTESFDTRSAGSSKTLTAAGVVDDGNGGSNYAVSFVANVTGQITPRDLAVTATAQGKVYDGTTTATVVLTGNQIVGDAVTLSDTSAAFADANAGLGKTVTVTGIALNGDDAADYNLLSTTASTTADITARAITVSATSVTKVYDGTTTTGATPTISSGSLAAGDTAAWTESFDTRSAGSSKTLTAAGVVDDGNGGSNYAVSFVTNVTGQITPRDLTVTATALGKVYDGTTTATVDLVGNPIVGDAVTLSDTSASFADANAGLGKTVTVTGIALNGDDAADYNLLSTTTSTTADITARAITVTATSATKVYDGTTTTGATPTISSGSLAAGDTAAWTESFDTRSAGSSKTLTAAGVVDDGNGGSNYAVSFVTDVTGQITPRDLAVTAIAQGKVYDGTTTATVDLTGNQIVGDAVTLSDTSASFADANAGLGKTVTVTGIALGGADAADYNLLSTTASTTADITARAITVTATSVTKVYDGTTSAAATPTISSGSLAAGDTAAWTESFDTRSAGSGKTLTAAGVVDDGNGGSNYAVSFVTNVTGQITPRDISITATAQGKVYDGTTTVTVDLTGNQIAGDAVTLSDTSAAFADANAGLGKTVTVTGIALNGADAANYNLLSTTTSTTADITARAITVSATGVTKVYDGTTSAAATPTISSGSLAAGDTAAWTESFDTRSAGSGKTLTAAGVVDDGNGGSNYAVSFVANVTGQITPRDLAVTATAQGKVYDGTTTATVVLTGNQIVGDAVTLSDTSASFADANAGLGKTVTVTGIALGGADAADYNLLSTTTSTTADITARTITVSATSATKVYDGTTTTGATPTISSGSLAAGDTAAWTESFDTKNAGSGKTLTAAGVVDDGNGGSNYAVSFVTNVTGQITPRDLTVTATALGKVYDGTTTATVDLVGNPIVGDAVTLSDTSASFADANAGLGKTVTVTGIALNGDDAADYNLLSTTTSTTADITARTITVSATSATKVYDGTTTTGATPTISSGSLAAGDTAAWTESFDTRSAGSSKTLTAAGVVDDGNGGSNYAVSFVTNVTGQITPRDLTVTATALGKVYDGTTTATVDLVGNPIVGDAVTLSDTSASFADANAGLGKTVTVTGIALNGDDAADYNLLSTTTSTTADITARTITVSATSATKVYDGTTTTGATPTISSGSLAAGDTAAWTESFDTRSAGSSKTLTAAGVVDDGNGGSNYAVSFVTNVTGQITPRDLAVTAIAQGKVYDGTTTATVDLTGNQIVGDAVTLSDTSASFADANAGLGKTVTVTGIALGGADAADYNLLSTTASTTADITARAITVTATSVTKVYDGTTSAAATPTISSGSLVAGDTAAWTESFDTKNAGSGKTLTAAGVVDDGNGGSNYAVSFVTDVTGQITPRDLAVTATAQGKVYDGTTTATVVLTGNQIVGDAVTLSDTSAAFADANAGLGKTVTVTGIALNGADAANYNLLSTTTSTTADITARAITVSATGVTKVYDGTTSAAATPTISSGSLAAGDTAAWTESFDTRSAGSGKTLTAAGVVDDGNGGSNYAVSFVANVTGQITPRDLAVTATAQGKVYDGTTTATVVLTGNQIVGDAVTLSDTSASFADANAGLGKTVTVTGIALNGDDAADYNLLSTTTSTTADITARRSRSPPPAPPRSTTARPRRAPRPPSAPAAWPPATRPPGRRVSIPAAPAAARRSPRRVWSMTATAAATTR